VEGLVHITELGADYFQFDDARHELRGERSGKRYQLTDKVKVVVSRVDIDARKIDLSLATSAVPNRFPKTREFEDVAVVRQGKRGVNAKVGRANDIEKPAVSGKSKARNEPAIYVETSPSKTKRKKVSVAASRAERKVKIAPPVRKKR
jgi:ribonuclease R